MISKTTNTENSYKYLSSILQVSLKDLTIIIQDSYKCLTSHLQVSYKSLTESPSNIFPNL